MCPDSFSMPCTLQEGSSSLIKEQEELPTMIWPSDGTHLVLLQFNFPKLLSMTEDYKRTSNFGH